MLDPFYEMWGCMDREAILKNTITLDIETFSECDLLECGAHRYAEDPTTELLLVNYGFEDGPLKSWEPVFGHPIPPELDAALDDPKWTKVAHNAPFEIILLRKLLKKKLPVSQWRCTMVHAHAMSLPGHLGMVGQILGVNSRGEVKSVGKKLIKYFCTTNDGKGRKYPKDDIDKWFKFVGYNEDDTAECRDVFVTLSQWPLRDADWRDWVLDQKINDRGLPIDIELVEACLDIDARERARLMARATELTGLANPNSRDQMLAWLQEEGEVEISNLKAKTVRDALAGAPGGAAEEVLEIRKSLSKTSVKKFKKFKSARCADGRLKGAYQFMGAGRTGRWAGRLVQTQNLYKNSFDDVDLAAKVAKTRDLELIDLLYGDIMWMIAGCSRPAIAAPPGKLLAPIDYSSIETVVIAWLAGCKRILETFRRGHDPYKEFATHLFSIDYEAVTKQQRNFCKPPTLGCGFYLGAPGLVEYAKQYGVTMTEEQAKHAVDTYRNVYWEIPVLWKTLDNAVRHVIETGESFDVGGKVRFERTADKMWLFAYLPSGRRLSYYLPELRMPDPESLKRRMRGKVPSVIRPAVTYVGIDTYTKQWCRIETHPGKITENLVQAIARDILMYGLHLVDVNGFEITGHTHDEIIPLVDESSAERDLKRLVALMSNCPPWCRDMPLRGTGWLGRHYKKD
jgi:DNA polymerase